MKDFRKLKYSVGGNPLWLLVLAVVPELGSPYYRLLSYLPYGHDVNWLGYPNQLGEPRGALLDCLLGPVLRLRDLPAVPVERDAGYDVSECQAYPRDHAPGVLYGPV